MGEWLDRKNKPVSNFRKLLQARVEKANPRRNLTAVKAKRLVKLEAIADKLKRGGKLKMPRKLEEVDENDHFDDDLVGGVGEVRVKSEPTITDALRGEPLVEEPVPEEVIEEPLLKGEPSFED